MNMFPIMQDTEENGFEIPGSIPATEPVQFELRLPNHMSDQYRQSEGYDHSDDVMMGSMFFELLSSQVFGGNSKFLFEEDLNVAEGYSYFADRAPNFTFTKMLEGVTMPREDHTRILNTFSSKPRLLQEQNNQLSSIEVSAFPVQKDREITPANLHQDLRNSSGNQHQVMSRSNPQIVTTPLSSECALPQLSSTSQSSEPRSTTITSFHIIGDQDEANLVQSSTPTLDEGTSSVIQGPNSSTSANCSEKFVDIQPGDCNLPSFADPKSGYPKSGHSAFPDRKKRKRSRACKNSQEVESQRMTHIAVERNRRKQMNEHLSVLRSLMPGSYIQRGDQASIIGGAIEFVKELEQILQSLQVQKRRRDCEDGNFSPLQGGFLSDFILGAQFAFNHTQADAKYANDIVLETREQVAESRSPAADVEVKMMGSDAIVKVLSQKKPGQLLKTIIAVESLQLIIMHLNITSIDQTVLYSFNVKVGVRCQLRTVSELALSFQQIFSMMHTNVEE